MEHGFKLSYDVVSVILYLAIFLERRLVPDIQADRRTDWQAGPQHIPCYYRVER